MGLWRYFEKVGIVDNFNFIIQSHTYLLCDDFTLSIIVFNASSQIYKWDLRVITFALAPVIVFKEVKYNNPLFFYQPFLMTGHYCYTLPLYIGCLMQECGNSSAKAFYEKMLTCRM